jgi:HlyD family secretion protein
MMIKFRHFIILILVIAIVFVVFNMIKNKNSSGLGTIKVSGNIEATQVRLSFRIPGKIRSLRVDEGSRVKAGDITASLEVDELSKVKVQADAALKVSTLAYQQAKDDYQRAENLFSNGAISAQKRDLAKTSADSAKANLDQTQANLELADIRMGFADLASPIDGFVVTKSAQLGEVVPAGAPIFTVDDLRDIWLTAYVNEADLGKIKLGQNVSVKTDSFSNKTYSGKISFISQEAEFTPKQIQTTEERVKLVYRVKIMIDNPDLELKPGMPADGYIIG